MVGCGGEVVKPWLRSRWASSAGVRQGRLTGQRFGRKNEAWNEDPVD
jgi:hypothetical protein